MAIDLAYASGSAVSLTNTETSLAVNGGSTTLQNLTAVGMYQLFFDGVANMAKGDEYLIKVYEKAVSGGTKRVIFQCRITDAQSEMLVIPPLMLGIGWDMTATRISATSRAFDWSIRRVS